MVLERFRKASEKYLEFLSKPFIMLGPTGASILGVLMAILAFVFFFYNYLLLAGFLVLLNGFFDMIDGYIARRVGKSSKIGDLIDHTLDRIADVFIMLGLTQSAYVSDSLGYLATIIMLLVSYMGTQAQALGVGRIYAGILGRADRIILIFIGCILQRIFTGKIWGLTVLDVLMLYFIVAGAITFAQRFKIAYEDLKNK
ncbi:MAG TPA: CDP-alcohol phosphatidyltransferase family protein [Euryarchaeota archaeon]|nr:CDP-alcohol phosphatidyltransferase family protein [Euryarchaeota archaeon]